MKVYSIDSQKQAVKEIEIEMQANTVYSFFNSILIDELTSLNGHVIYSDANAISEEKKPFFMGEQLIVGDALIFGKDGLIDIEATIPKADLESLVNYEVSDFYIESLKILKSSSLNLYRTFELSKEGEDIKLNSEWVLHVFNMADSKTKEYFISELKKAIETKVEILEHFQKMALLALNATA